MPNIKIYGIVNLNNSEATNVLTADDLSKDIKDIFKDKDYAEHIVITFICSSVHDLKRKSQPYIQLELDCMKNYKEKIKLLKTLGYDIQVVKLHDFIPKE